MFLRVQLTEAVNGYWDGGKKSVFDFRVDGRTQHDKQGEYVRVGSWDANHWFHVSVGKTERDTLRKAQHHIARTFKKKGLSSSFSIREG